MTCLEDGKEVLSCTNICRLCVQKDDCLWNIFDVCDDDGTNLELSDKIIASLDIMVEVNDGLPDMVCGTCMTAVRAFHEFRQLCKHHDRELRNSLANLKGKKSSESRLSGSLHVEECKNPPLENGFDEKTPSSEDCTESVAKVDPVREVPQAPQHNLFLDDYSADAVSSAAESLPLVKQLEQDWGQEDVIELDGSLSGDSFKNCEPPWRINDVVSVITIESTDYAGEQSSVITIESPDYANEQSSVIKIESPDFVDEQSPIFTIESPDFANEQSSVILIESTDCANEQSSLSESLDRIGNEDPLLGCEDIVLFFKDNEDQSNSESKSSNDNAELELGSMDSADVGGILPAAKIKTKTIDAGKISRNESGLWVCTLCNEPYKNLSKLKQHFVKHYSKIGKQCLECGDSFQTIEELEQHKAQHTTSSLVLGFTCNHCHKSFRLEHVLEKHVSLVHPSSEITKTVPEEFQVPCGKCFRVFYSTAEMENHEDSCGEDVLDSEEDSPDANVGTGQSGVKHFSKRKDCYICKLSFDNLPQLTFHFKNVHKGDKPLRCNVFACGKLFSKTSQLSAHVRRTHRRNKTCDFCEKKFKERSELLGHMRFHHLDERPYECEQCGKKFPSHRRLYCHVQRHSRYKCDKCDATFTSKHGVSRHQVSHTGEQPYVCESCGKRFAYAETLRKHKLAEQAEKLVCAECGETFCNKFRLKIHLHQHTKKKLYVCKLCSAQFSHLTTLAKHKKAKHSSKTE